MLDGSARAGAAISITEITQKPLKFEGIGEHIDDIQVFNPKSMADRVLGMGDIVNLVKKAEHDEKNGIFQKSATNGSRDVKYERFRPSRKGISKNRRFS